MRGGLLPAALLCLAFGLAMGFAPRRAAATGTVLLATTAIAAAVLPWPLSTEAAFAGCWASLIAAALTAYLPRGVPHRATPALAIAAGVFAGAVVNREADPSDLALALPLALAGLPARWAVTRGWSIGIRIICSWLIGVALLSALLPAAGTPGYVADHMG